MKLGKLTVAPIAIAAYALIFIVIPPIPIWWVMSLITTRSGSNLFKESPRIFFWSWGILSVWALLGGLAELMGKSKKEPLTQPAKETNLTEQ